MKEGKSKTPYAKKSFGQNFLVDNHYIEKIIAALDPHESEKIVEIGGGRGALTGKLLESGADVTVIELEREMIAVLREKFAGAENFHLVENDALKIDFSELAGSKAEIPDRRAKLVANLPYYISTAILQRLIEQRGVFSEMILMFQREVVERITAEVGNRERGFLSVLTEAFLTAEKLFDVPPSAFRPAPKVWSAVVRLRPQTDAEIGDESLFRELISAGFAQKRKTILNNLKNAPAALRARIGDAARLLADAGIEPNRRAETLRIEEWLGILARLA